VHQATVIAAVAFVRLVFRASSPKSGGSATRGCRAGEALISAAGTAMGYPGELMGERVSGPRLGTPPRRTSNQTVAAGSAAVAARRRQNCAA